jgi:putative ABC transport system substrate-binding protein
MRRRELLGLLGGAAVEWPLTTWAQKGEMPIIGYLSSRTLLDSGHIVAAFHQGLRETGFVEKANVVIEARFAEGDFDQLPKLAADLVGHRVNVLVATGGTVSAVRAKPLIPMTIPLVFAMGGDPVKLGIVASLNRPGNNVTGVSFLVNRLAAKEIEFLHELVPNASTVGLLVNPKDPNAESDTREAQAAADALGQKLVIAGASTDAEIDLAFAKFVERKVGGLVVDTEPFFTDRRHKIVGLAAAHALPAVYQLREFATAGGLISYGTSITDANRLLGVYTGRILKGTKPGDLPVLQSTKFELIINNKAAKALGLTIPPTLLARADEVIE